MTAEKFKKMSMEDKKQLLKDIVIDSFLDWCKCWKDECNDIDEQFKFYGPRDVKELKKSFDFLAGTLSTGYGGFIPLKYVDDIESMYVVGQNRFAIRIGNHIIMERTSVDILFRPAYLLIDVVEYCVNNIIDVEPCLVLWADGDEELFNEYRQKIEEDIIGKDER